MLSEDWISSGKPLRRTVAVQVETAQVEMEAFTVASASPFPGPAPLAIVQPLPLSEVPETGGPYMAARKPPWGFRLEARSRAFALSAFGELSTGESFTDAYVKDTYVFTVEHTREELSDTGRLRAVQIEGLGTGQVIAAAAGFELRFRLGHWTVRLRGNLGVEYLIEFARHLRTSGAQPEAGPTQTQSPQGPSDGR